MDITARQLSFPAGGQQQPSFLTGLSNINKKTLQVPALPAATVHAGSCSPHSHILAKLYKSGSGPAHLPPIRSSAV